MSLVQRSVLAGELALASMKGMVHFAANSSFVRMLVVVYRPQRECR
jgi:hypothetical protein